MTTLDLSHLQASTLMLKDYNHLHLALVGCGGSGSWLALHLARLAMVISKTRAVEVSLVFIDHDIVEEANISRQNFCYAEVGLPKAKVLAARYGMAWGIQIGAVCDRFDVATIRPSWRELAVVVGCVDNAAARAELHKALNRNNQELVPSIWWLDGGNSESSGQVLLGSAPTHSALSTAFTTPGIASSLPSPALQHPELLEPLPSELSDNNMSCEELAVANAQSLMVNQQVAAIAGDFLVRMLISRNLRRFATYFDLMSGSSRSKYITRETVESAIAER